MLSLKNNIPSYIKDFIYFESKILELDYNSRLDDSRLEEHSLGMANVIIDIGSSIESISKELHQYLYEQDSNIFPAYTNRHENFDYYALAALDITLALSEKKLKFKQDFIHSNKYQQIQPLKYAHLGDDRIKELINAKKLPSDAKRPEWCQAYPRLRHDRLNNKEYGTVFNAIEALGAFFILLTYSQYLANISLPLSYDNAPKLQEYSLLEPIFSSHLFKPTTCRPMINNFADNMNNDSLSSLEALPESMFVIKDSLVFIQQTRFHQIETELTVKAILCHEDGFCKYIDSIDLTDQTLPILIYNYANNIKHDPKWGERLNNMLFSPHTSYFTLCANSFSKNQVNNSKLWPEMFLNIFCYKKVSNIINKNHKTTYDTSEVKYHDIYDYSLINTTSKESIEQQIKQNISHITNIINRINSGHIDNRS